MDDYEVGYKKPPKKHQFKPGTSGNHKGRIKGHRNIKNDLMEELSQSIIITENGKKKKLSKQQVFIKQLCTKAMGGDANSGRLLATLILKYLGDEPDSNGDGENILPLEDRELLDHVFKNVRKNHE